MFLALLLFYVSWAYYFVWRMMIMSKRRSSEKT